MPTGSTSFVEHFSKLASDGGKLYIYDDRSYNYSPDNKSPQDDEGRFDIGVFGELVEETKEIAYIDIQVGANEGQFLRVELPITTLKTLKLDDPYLSVASSIDAKESIKRIDKAVEQVTNERSRMGAYQNRLKHTINNLSNTEENLQ